jgi:hypothetical protein
MKCTPNIKDCPLNEEINSLNLEIDMLVSVIKHYYLNTDKKIQNNKVLLTAISLLRKPIRSK